MILVSGNDSAVRIWAQLLELRLTNFRTRFLFFRSKKMKEKKLFASFLCFLVFLILDFGLKSFQTNCFNCQLDLIIRRGVKLERNIYLLFVPDEETGGELGMGKFIQSERFKSLNIGFVLDQGMPNPTKKFFVFNGERSVRTLYIDFKGNTGRTFSHQIVHALVIRNSLKFTTFLSFCEVCLLRTNHLSFFKIRFLFTG